MLWIDDDISSSKDGCSRWEHFELAPLFSVERGKRRMLQKIGVDGQKSTASP